MVMEISTLRRQLGRHAAQPQPRGPATTAVIIPFPQSRPRAETPFERYPCTRMHGAAFEAAEQDALNRCPVDIDSCEG